ncbi:uncharacterized protein TrAFT101_000436 [Trichoderma asperellum]|uniref:uncharacterized protein n=1 Tax=Trichoderma asperellum TaxID=101201 RepID=UPI00331EA6EB|nr:hypothetical protein TrAFT101_000436 [Trichoderma asperellum]
MEADDVISGYEVCLCGPRLRNSNFFIHTANRPRSFITVYAGKSFRLSGVLIRLANRASTGFIMPRAPLDLSLAARVHRTPGMRRVREIRVAQACMGHESS